MKIHLVDGTYELFRAYFAQPSRQAPDGREVGAVRGLMQTLLHLLWLGMAVVVVSLVVERAFCSKSAAWRYIVNLAALGPESFTPPSDFRQPFNRFFGFFP